MLNAFGVLYERIRVFLHDAMHGRIKFLVATHEWVRFYFL